MALFGDLAEAGDCAAQFQGRARAFDGCHVFKWTAPALNR